MQSAPIPYVGFASLVSLCSVLESLVDKKCVEAGLMSISLQ